jgi:hypothetical protein
MTKLSGVYLIEFTHGTKIGSSLDIVRSLKNLKRDNYTEILRTHVIECFQPHTIKSLLKVRLNVEYDYKAKRTIEDILQVYNDISYTKEEAVW